MTSIAERVAAGAAWLDDTCPGWRRDVDVDRLSVANPCNCVLGQLFDDFDDRPAQLQPLQVARDLGFEISRNAGGNTREYQALTAEWRRVITSRREAAT